MTNEEVWQNAYYFTLSSIAQTLAAAFGILSAFMLYRFQHAETKIGAHEERITETVSTMEAEVQPDELVGRLKESHATAVKEVVGEAVDMAVERTDGEGTSGQQSEVERLQTAGEEISFWSSFHKRALRRLRHALLLTVSTIGFCLVLLPLMPLLTRWLPLAATLTLLSVLLALVCLTLYARLILLLLTPETDAEQ